MRAEMEFDARIETYPLKEPFRFANASFEATEALTVAIRDGAFRGRGEAQGAFYLGETAQSILADAVAFFEAPDGLLSCDQLQTLLPPCGARNAIDCALWDLEAKKRNSSIWELTGFSPTPLTTAFTIGLEEDAEAMASKAYGAAGHSLLKVKLNADAPVSRIEAIRLARPDAQLIVDVNQAWSFAELSEYAPALAQLGVAMIEQPLPRGKDEELCGYNSPIPLCADESCLHSGELECAKDRYQLINIKLDKTGGLTEALRLARLASENGLGLMVGNMLGTSLAMAPSFVIGLSCRFVDLDGPMMLAQDRKNGLRYKNGIVDPPAPALWG